LKRNFVGTTNSIGQSVLPDICSSALQATSILAETKDSAEKAKETDAFLKLYWGSMNLIEIQQGVEHILEQLTKGDDLSALRNSDVWASRIEASMVRFGRGLGVVKGELPFYCTSLCCLARAVRDECNAYLKMSAPEPCTGTGVQ
jgi:hypothetical protein